MVDVDDQSNLDIFMRKRTIYYAETQLIAMVVKNENSCVYIKLGRFCQQC